MSVIIFIIILAVLVLAHELGHFSVAKFFKIRVDEFGLGFPPRIWAKKKGETEYSINSIPFGGFVKIFGEDGLEENKDPEKNKNSFASKNRLIQAAVLLAGIFANFVLAWLLISIGFMVGLPAPIDSDMGQVTGAKLTIVQVLPDSPAFKAGLKSGDTIISLSRSGDTIQNPTSEQTQNFINQSKTGLKLDYARGSEKGEVSIIPKEGITEGRLAVGIAMDMIGTLRLPFFKAFYVGGSGLGTFAYQALTGKASIKEVSGPVGIAGIVGDAEHLGFGYLISIAAFISLNLAVINLIPFPALDGGRVLFVIIESIKRSPVNSKITQTVNTIGFALLIILMIVVTYNDIIKLI